MAPPCALSVRSGSDESPPHRRGGRLHPRTTPTRRTCSGGRRSCRWPSACAAPRAHSTGSRGAERTAVGGGARRSARAGQRGGAPAPRPWAARGLHGAHRQAEGALRPPPPDGSGGDLPRLAALDCSGPAQVHLVAGPLYHSAAGGFRALRADGRRDRLAGDAQFRSAKPLRLIDGIAARRHSWPPRLLQAHRSTCRPRCCAPLRRLVDCARSSSPPRRAPCA